MPSGDSLVFNYVFASEEYLEFVGAGVNDAFAFILTGVTVPYPSTNIALIPGTSTPVSIDDVNVHAGAFSAKNQTPRQDTGATEAHRRKHRHARIGR